MDSKGKFTKKKKKKKNVVLISCIRIGELNVNKMTYAHSDNSDQPGHTPSLTSHHCPHEGSLGCNLPIERIAKTDQMGR